MHWLQPIILAQIHGPHTGISLGAALGLAVSSTDPRVKALVNYFGPLPQGAIAADLEASPDIGAPWIGRSHRASGQRLCGRGAAAPAERAA